MTWPLTRIAAPLALGLIAAAASAQESEAANEADDPQAAAQATPVIVEADRDTPLDILLNVVEFYVRNARDSYQFFYQLWGFAGSGDDARDMVRELYRPIGRFIFYLVRAANPKLTDAQVRQAVLQIFSQAFSCDAMFCAAAGTVQPATVIAAAARVPQIIPKRMLPVSHKSGCPLAWL